MSNFKLSGCSKKEGYNYNMLLIRNDSALVVKLVEGTVDGWNSGRDGVHSTLSIATMMLSCQEHEAGSEGTTERPVPSVMTQKRERLALPPVKVCIDAAYSDDHQFITALLPPARRNHTLGELF